MGGPSNSTNPIDLAAEITDKQLHLAKQLDTKHFQGRSTPELQAAIIQALATNYAAVIATK